MRSRIGVPVHHAAPSTGGGGAPGHLRLVNAQGGATETAPIRHNTLFVLALSDSLEHFWPTMAEQLGLAFRRVETVEHLATATHGMILVAAAGDEGALPDVLARLCPHRLPVVAAGVDEGRRTAVNAVRAGAQEYFCLPQEVDALRSHVKQWIAAGANVPQVEAFTRAQRDRHRFAGVLGTSPTMLEAIARAERVLPHDRLTLLLSGETGTGKEVFARAIHYNGPRSAMPFVAVNCAAIPLQLLESELFGHERGAFTGAAAAKPGLFEVANGGTILLDEIGHMDLTLQGKLLRALEERTIRRVGGAKDQPIDVRVLAATHVDLGRAVDRNEFRADLYYRLNVVAITLPPLRERGADVHLLAQHFISKVASDYGVPEPTLSDGARHLIARYPWPGNVRELRNAMERATLLALNGVIQEVDLELDETRAPIADGRLPFPAPLTTIIQSALHEMLALHGGNRSEAARRLGISRSRLHRLLAVGGTMAEDESA